MRVTFVIHSLGHMGGAEKILVTLASALSTRGYKITLLTLDDKKSLFELPKQIQLIQKRDTSKERKKWFHLPVIEQINWIKNHLENNQTDITISLIGATNVLVAIAAYLAHIPSILWEHSSYHRSVTEGRGAVGAMVWRVLRRISYPLAKHLVLLTKEDLPKYHYVQSVSVIPNPLVLKNTHKDIMREKIILGVGRLHPVKGFDMLLDAFAQSGLNDWQLNIAGEGDERKNLERQIKRLGIEDRVKLLGLVKDMEMLYKKSTIFVLSSRSEGFPGGLCEAMGYGCACIAFDCPTGPKEIITPNVDGILVESNDVDALAHSMNHLANTPQKSALLAQHAISIKKTLHIETIVKVWEDIIDTVIK